MAMSDSDRLMAIKNLYCVNGVSSLADAISVIDAVIDESSSEHTIKMLKESRADLVYFMGGMRALV